MRNYFSRFFGEDGAADERRSSSYPREKVNNFGGEDSEDEIDTAEEDDSCRSEASVSDVESEEVDDD
ncbi:unnamed protein product [Hermetia illucens]|uniref:Uncharacterized protein n=1 Tax=Hermetia illucens TaxID=343691 RepID=A0A7R8UK34_HERIL|nr:unnamed protein product [Hermetia illucens]